MSGGLGGGVVVAAAAVLWLAYLTPSWVRRRQYLSTERTAVRLQQTLRILAETADVPDEVRAEVSARSVAEQHRALRASARRAEAVARPLEAAAERALVRRRRPAPREPRQRADAVSAIGDARLRRSRLLATVLLVAGVLAVAAGALRVVPGGEVVLLVAGAVVALVAVALLQRAATVAAAHRAVVAVDHAVPAQAAPQSFTDWQRTEQERPTWTPVPLPKPLYLDREEAARSRPARPDTGEQLKAASRQAEEALRSAHAAAEAVAIDATTDAQRAGLRAMGVVPPSEPVLSDLDAVLRRRRAG